MLDIPSWGDHLGVPCSTGKSRGKSQLCTQCFLFHFCEPTQWLNNFFFKLSISLNQIALQIIELALTFYHFNVKSIKKIFILPIVFLWTPSIFYFFYLNGYERLPKQWHYFWYTLYLFHIFSVFYYILCILLYFCICSHFPQPPKITELSYKCI